MDILFHHPFFNPDDWLIPLKQQLPEATFHVYQKGENPPADYAFVWKPTYEMLASRKDLKAVFALGAGVDAILDQLRETPDLIPNEVPLYRLQDAGMIEQMEEYSIAAVMRYFRRLDEYQQLQQQGRWKYLEPYTYQEFVIGVMGLGVLGSKVAERLASLGFTVKGWSRSPKNIANVKCYSESQLSDFLKGTKLIINLLPSTPQTQGVLNKTLFSQLAQGAYLINIARGKHLIDDDLILALNSKQVKAATLDVFVKEPLPEEHPFWQHPTVTITPHISAITRPAEAIPQLVQRLRRLERGEQVYEGLVDLGKGY